MRHPRALRCRPAVLAIPIPIAVALAASGVAAQDLRATDSAGNLRAFVGLSTDDSGLIELYSAGGRDTVELFSDDEGGTILLRNGGGEATVSLANGETGGDLFLGDPVVNKRARIWVSTRAGRNEDETNSIAASDQTRVLS